GNSAVITGNVNVLGNVNASGTLMDNGGNSNHHSH
ncbi:phage baseplate assembly protein V, partial [Salmonella enterica subsp. enterica serovar Heidelberg]|nr:phage baseplate assembly protein V [Salmonella enterica subsp. enterica serovar Heidelberg]